MKRETATVDIESYQTEMEIDRETLEELYSVFVEELSLEKEKITEALENNCIDELERIIHNIKGISSNYKAEKVFKKVSELSVFLKEKKFNELTKLGEELEITINEAMEEIIGYFGREE